MLGILINIAYLHDILAYMIEAQYWGDVPIQDYRGFVEEYKERAEQIRTDDRHEAFKEGLKHTLKGLLNNPQIDYDAIVLKGAMHGMGSQEKAQELLEMIWHVFYADENWRDETFVADNPGIVERQFVA